MRSSVLLTALSAGAFARASMIPRENPNCNGEVYNGICCVNGEWAGPVISTAASSAISGFDSSVSTYYTGHSSSISAALSSAASKVSTFISANSLSLQSDLSSAQPFLSTLSNTLKAFESTVTPPPDPFAKRGTVTIHASSIGSVLHGDVDDLRNNINEIKATWSPPDVIFDKRTVSVVSQGLTCYGQAVVTLSASNAASLIASATSAASGTKYFANGSSGTFVVATATSTSTSTGGAAMITRGPMLAVGGAAVAFAFAAM